MKQPCEPKRMRPFALGDVWIYAAVAVLIAVVCVVAFVPARAPIQGLTVYYENTAVYHYDCASRQGVAYPVDGVIVIREGEDVIIETPRGRNVLSVAEGDYRMKEADCRGGQCVRDFAPLRQGGDILVCLPHALRVVAEGDVGNEVIP